MNSPTLEPFREVIQEMKMQGKTYKEISTFLTSTGVQRGCSIDNIKRFCADNNFLKGVVSATHLELAVAKGIQEVGTQEVCFSVS